jgi:HNH endonuclease
LTPGKPPYDSGPSTRDRWACQACGARTQLEIHHVQKRSRGGSDFELDKLVTVCRPCHTQTDAPYATGRLVVTPFGAGRFGWTVVRRRSKWDGTEPTPRQGSSSFSRAGRVAHVGNPGRVHSGLAHLAGPPLRVVDISR